MNFSSRHEFGKIQVQNIHYCPLEKYAYCMPTFIHRYDPDDLKEMGSDLKKKDTALYSLKIMVIFHLLFASDFNPKIDDIAIVGEVLL